MNVMMSSCPLVVIFALITAQTTGLSTTSPPADNTTSAPTTIASNNATTAAPTINPVSNITTAAPTTIASNNATTAAPTINPVSNITTAAPTTIASNNATTAAPTINPVSNMTTAAPTTIARDNTTTAAPTINPVSNMTTAAPTTIASNNATTAAPTINPVSNVTTAAPTTIARDNTTTAAPTINPVSNVTTAAPTTIARDNTTTAAPTINPVSNMTTAAPTTIASNNATTAAPTINPVSNMTTAAPTTIARDNTTTAAPTIDSTTTSTPTMSSISSLPTTFPFVVVGVEAVFKVTNKIFSVQLLNRSSAVFQGLQQLITQELSSLLSDQIRNIQVMEIRIGSVQVKTEFDVIKREENSISNVQNLLGVKIGTGSLGSLKVDPSTFYFITKEDARCLPPNVTITNLAASPSKPTEIKRSEAYIVQTDVKVNCSNLTRTSLLWTVWTLKPSGNDYVLSSPSKPHFVLKKTAEWNIRKRDLPYGLYLIEFRVSLNDFKGIFSSDLKFLHITTTPIVAGIIGGSHVRRGFNKDVILNASSSYDPDFGPNDFSGMTFTWLCKKKGETFPTISLDNMPVVSPSGTKGNGGCFDTGIGKLSSSDPVATLNTGDMMVDTSYVIKLFVVKVSHNGLVRKASFEQVLDVVKGDPPQMSISCRINCASKTNPSSRMKVTTTCISPKRTCSMQLRYRWSLKKKEDGSWNPVPNLKDNFSTPLTSPDAVIKENVLAPDKYYQLTVDVESNGVVPGLASYIFKTNSPPMGGSCDISPKTGKGLKTQFTFSCKDWTDIDQPLMYQFYYVTEPGLTSVIAYGQDKQAQFKLPVGKKEQNYEIKILILVVDSLAAFTKDEKTVKVEPITSQSSDELKKDLEDASKEVDLLLKTGDVKKASQLANAVLDTMSSAKQDEIDEKERTKLIDNIVNQMASNVKTENLQTLTQVTSVFGRATANPDEVSLSTQDKTMNSLEEMADLLVEKSEDRSASEDSLVEASGENLALSIGNAMRSAAKKADVNKEKENTKQSKESITVANKSVVLVDKVGESLLKRKVVGESPSVVKTASLSMVLGRQKPEDLNKTKIKEGEMSFVLPPTDILGTELRKLKFVDSQMTFTRFNPFTWDTSADLVNSVVSSLVLRNDQGSDIPIEELKQDIQISIPQSDSQSNTSLEERSFLKPKQIRDYKFFIDHPGKAIELQVTTSKQAGVKILVKHNEKPSESSNDYAVLLSNLPSCSPVQFFEACRKENGGIFLSSLLLQKRGLYYVGILLDSSSLNSRKKRSCFGHGRQKRSCVEPKDPPKPENMTIIPKYDPKTDVNYSVSTQQYVCLFWNGDKWTSKGCKAGSYSNATTLQCFCNHLTSFGGSLLIAPNPIDFDVVLLELLRLDETNNIAVLCTIAIFLAIYLVIAVIARRADRRDTKKFGPPLAVNPSDSNRYQYEMTVVTGVWRNCGTTANVVIEIYGSQAKSNGIILSRDMEPSRIILANGNADKFIISLSESLGYIEYLNVWHDNSGSSPSWFLDRIIIRDVQTDFTWVFLHRNWIALEKGDGEIKKLLLPTSPLEMKSFQYKFNYRTAKKFTEDHIWLSVLTKPPHSNFTRLQRATCCLCVLFSAMVVNAMFYKLDKTPDPRVQVGPLKFSWRQISVGIYSSLIVVPVGLVIVFLFQYSRPKSEEKRSKRGKKETILESICCHLFDKKRGKVSASRECLASGDQLSDTPGESATRNQVDSGECTTMASCAAINLNVTENDQKVKEKDAEMNVIDDNTNDNSFGTSDLDERNLQNTRKTSNILHKVDEECTLLVAAETDAMDLNTSQNLRPNDRSTCNSPIKKSYKEIFTDMFYSKDKEDSQFWLPHCCIYISWVLCFITVSVSASFTFMYSLQWGKEIANQWLSSMLVTFTEDLFVVQPVKICITAIFMALFFQNKHGENAISSRESEKPIKPNKVEADVVMDRVDMKFPEQSELEKAKAYQVKEEKMFSFVREVAIFSAFLALLTIVCYGNRSYFGYEMTKTVKNEYSNFSKLATSEKYWKWINTQYAQSTYAGSWYNDAMEPNEVYIGNKRSILIGMPRIRQLRIKADTCIIPKEARSIASVCYDKYSFKEEDRTPLYVPGWDPVDNTNTNWNNLSELCPKPWRYKTADDLGDSSSWGYFHIYSGGGYVADLGYNNKTTTFVASPLRKNNWLDHRTRVLMLEFAFFNPSTNLLSAITFYYEVLPITFGHSFQVIETIALYGTESASYDFFLICKLLFIFLAIFYLAREARRAYKMRRIYFKNLWNWLEIIQVFIALTVVVFYVIKEKMLLNAVQRVKENPYLSVNFQPAMLWKNAEDTALSLAVFVATVKILRMLRFNPHVIIFSNSLKSARETLLFFSVILSVVMVSFALFQWITLGTSMYRYHTILQAFYSQLLMSLGAKMHLKEIRNSLPILGPLFGFCYKVLMAFIFLNFYISVINDSYEEIKSKTDSNSKEFEMSEFILERLKEMFFRKTYKTGSDKNNAPKSTNPKPDEILPSNDEKDNVEDNVLKVQNRHHEDASKEINTENTQEPKVKCDTESTGNEEIKRISYRMRRALRKKHEEKIPPSLEKKSDLAKQKRQCPPNIDKDIKNDVNSYDEAMHRSLEETCSEINKRTNAMKKEEKDEDIEFARLLYLFLKLVQTRPQSVGISELGEDNAGYSPDWDSSSSLSMEHNDEGVESYESYDIEVEQEELWGSTSDLFKNLILRRKRIPDHLRFRNTMLEDEADVNVTSKQPPWRP